MQDCIVAEWWATKHAWRITNGISTIWCDDMEFNDTIRELKEELAEYLSSF